MKGHDMVPSWTSSHLVTSPSSPSHRSKGTNDNSCSEVEREGSCSLAPMHKIRHPFTTEVKGWGGAWEQGWGLYTDGILWTSVGYF